MDAIAALAEVDFLSVLISVFIILMALKTIVSILEWAFQKLGIEFKWVKSRSDEHDLLNKTAEEVKNIKNDIMATKKEYADKRYQDREENSLVYKEITEAINNLTDKVEKLTEQSKRYELSDTRDRLLQAHRYYTDVHTNPLHMWTDMESHAFWEQFDTYVSLGGDDYMHTDVEPDMRKLISISMSDVNGIAKLMESRYKKSYHD